MRKDYRRTVVLPLSQISSIERRWIPMHGNELLIAAPHASIVVSTAPENCVDFRRALSDRLTQIRSPVIGRPEVQAILRGRR